MFQWHHTYFNVTSSCSWNPTPDDDQRNKFDNLKRSALFLSPIHTSSSLATFEKLFNSKLIFLSGLFVFLQEGFFSLSFSQEDTYAHRKVYRASQFREELWNSLKLFHLWVCYALWWFALVLDSLAGTSTCQVQLVPPDSFFLCLSLPPSSPFLFLHSFSSHLPLFLPIVYPETYKHLPSVFIFFHTSIENIICNVINLYANNPRKTSKPGLS